MSVAQKLWFAFGFLILIALIVGIVGYLGVNSVHKTLQPVPATEDAEDRAVEQMQRSVALTEGVVLGYLETGDPEYRERLDEHARAFEETRSRYEQSVTDQRSEKAMARVASLYDEYRAAGEDLVAGAEREKELVAQSEASLARTAAVLSRIQAEVGDKEPDRFDKVVEASRMAGSISKTGARVGLILADEGRESSGSTKGVSEDFAAASKSFRELELTEQQEDSAGELERLFDETEPLVEEAVSLKTSRREDVSRFLGLRADIDDSLSEVRLSALRADSAVQGLAREAASQASSRAAATILIVLVVGLVLAGLVAAALGGGIVRSVRRLAKGATYIVNDDFDHHLEVSTKDELGVVASALNRLAEERQYDREELRHFGRFLEDRTKRLAELEAAVAGLPNEEPAPYGERRHEGAASSYEYGTFDWDLQKNTVYWDEGALRFFGVAREDSGQTYEAFLNAIHPEDRHMVERATELGLEHGLGPEVNFRIATAGGEVITCAFRAEASFGHDGKPVRMIGHICEANERQAPSQNVSPMTNGFRKALPERAVFIDHVDQALLRTRGYGEPLAVLLVELDNFKGIYSALGPEPTERLMAAVRERLQSCLEPDDDCKRLEDDEFAILLERRDEIGARRVAERIAEAMSVTFPLDGRQVSVPISIGIALDRGAEDRPADLVHAAHCATYQAKQNGKTKCAVFDSSISARALERVELESDLRLALEREEFVVYYQPKVMLDTLDVFAFEALVRWNHPKRGIVLPDDFIPLAEETGLIVPIGQVVLREACSQARAWQDRYPETPPLTVSVNLSPQQLDHPELVESIIEVLVDTGLEPRSLMLEVTENVLIDDSSRVRADLQRLRDLGVRIAVDDFGTAYSSLSRLKCLPVDVLKLDRSFMAGLEKGDDGGELVAGVLGLASGLGVEVIAEGVETARQLQRLRDVGCDRAQGYYFSRPVPGGNATALLKSARGT